MFLDYNMIAIIFIFSFFSFTFCIKDIDFLKFTNSNTIQVSYTNWKNLKGIYNYQSSLFNYQDKDYQDKEDYELWHTIFNQSFNESIELRLYKQDFLKLKNHNLFYESLYFLNWQADIYSSNKSYETILKMDSEYDMDNLKSFFDDNFSYLSEYKKYYIYKDESEYPVFGFIEFFLINIENNILILLSIDNSIELIDNFYNNNFNNINKHFIYMTKHFNPPLSFMLLSDQNNIYENISPFDRVLQTIKQSQWQNEGNESNPFLEQPVIDSSIIKRLKEEYGRNSNIASQLNDSKAIGFGYNIKDYSKNKKSNGYNISSRIIASFDYGTEKSLDLRLDIYNDLRSYKYGDYWKDILPVDSCFESRNLLICDFNRDDRILFKAYISREHIFDIFTHYE